MQCLFSNSSWSHSSPKSLQIFWHVTCAADPTLDSATERAELVLNLCWTRGVIFFFNKICYIVRWESSTKLTEQAFTWKPCEFREKHFDTRLVFIWLLCLSLLDQLRQGNPKDSVRRTSWLFSIHFSWQSFFFFFNFNFYFRLAFLK